MQRATSICKTRGGSRKGLQPGRKFVGVGTYGVVHEATAGIPSARDRDIADPVFFVELMDGWASPEQHMDECR
jgi:hypothetical protein